MDLMSEAEVGFPNMRFDTLQVRIVAIQQHYARQDAADVNVVDQAVGSMISQTRRDRSISSTYLAAASQLSDIMLKRIEDGLERPNPGQLLAIANNLNVDVSNFFVLI
jgi:ribosome-binding protein aMBF1 (putative translation factor)